MKKLHVKIILIIGLLLCLINMPFWYYQIVHLFGSIGFFYLAYIDYSEDIRITPQLFFTFGLLYNPILKISFGKELWQSVDILVSTLIIVSIFLENRLRSFNH